MKKAVKAVSCLIIVMGIVLSLAACGEGITGRYELVRMENNGQTLDIAALKALAGSDVDMYLELFDDGTAVLKMDSDTTQMIWEAGQIWPANREDEKVSFTVDGDVISMEKDGVTLIFEK